MPARHYAQAQGLAAAGLAPTLAAGDYADLDRRLAAERGLRRDAERGLAEDMARHRHGQYAPLEMAGFRGAQIYGFPGRVSESSSRRAGGK